MNAQPESKNINQEKQTYRSLIASIEILKQFNKIEKYTKMEEK